MAAQFRVENFALPWQSADGSSALVAANAATNGWVNPALVGGHPATPAWNRPWPGRVYEVVFLDTVPQGNLIDALRSYLSQKWGLGFDAAPPQDARELLRQFGVKTVLRFSSVIIAR